MSKTIYEKPKSLTDTTFHYYCRSGNRSKQAANKLTALGYKSIVEFGGFMDYTGEIEY